MNSKEFTAWLSGFLEANSSKRLNEKQINQIKEKMKTISDPPEYRWYWSYPWITTNTGTGWLKPLDYTITTSDSTNVSIGDQWMDTHLADQYKDK